MIPVIVFLATRSACRSLQRSGAHPLREWEGEIVRRQPDGSVMTVAISEDRQEEPITEPPVGTVPGTDPD